jgi:hypothetical protein
MILLRKVLVEKSISQSKFKCTGANNVPNTKLPCYAFCTEPTDQDIFITKKGQKEYGFDTDYLGELTGL